MFTKLMTTYETRKNLKMETLTRRLKPVTALKEIAMAVLERNSSPR